ncbi:Phosphoribosylglycinamide formyltransferase [hydrothermal vent metagenome]|uniref:Phosphoribosylglycinamide formyltransferase n=1 Tax=hydrothermal vent metagenome TaxID=652676 RepID=A0A3B1AAA6_9ZZZZ
MIVTPLLKQGVNIVGVSEVYDHFGNMNKLRQWIERLYWQVCKKQESPYLSLFAQKNNIAYAEKKRGDNDEYMAWLRELNPDVLVLHQAPILIPDIFSIPRFGTLNIHPSLLPKYRGSNPYFWMYYDLDMTAGITLHYIDENIDTGDIVGQGGYSIELGTPASAVGKVLVNNYAIPLLIKAIQTLESTGKLKTIPQPVDSPTPYAKRLTVEAYYEALDFENWELEHLWHVLNSNDQWRDVFLAKIENSGSYNWTIKGIERREVNMPYGEIEEDSGGYHIKHKQGVIYLNRVFSMRKFFTSLFKLDF